MCGKLLAIAFSRTLGKQDTRAINDPLGQTHISASSDHYFRLNFVLCCEILKVGTDGRTEERKDGRTEVQTTTGSANIVITTGHDCGSASWINSSV